MPRLVRIDETLQSASLAASGLGFYENPEQRLPIVSIRLAADVPAGERANIEDMEHFGVPGKTSFNGFGVLRHERIRQ